MMHTYIHSTTDIRRAIQYPMTDKREQKGLRIEGIRCGGGLVDTGDKRGIVEQFNIPLDAAGRHRMKGVDGTYPIQGYKTTFSFSRKEIDPNDPEGADKALDIIQQVMDNRAKDRLYILIAQKDGKGGLWHVHGVECAVHSSTLKALSGRETSYDIMRKQTEHYLEKAGIEPDAGENHDKRKRTKGAMHRKGLERQGKSWMQDLETRIKGAADQATTKDEFRSLLEASGVSVPRESKTGWTYAMEVNEGKKTVTKKVRYDRFQEDFSQKTLNKQFAENFRSQKEEKRPEKSTEEVQSAERRLPDVSNIMGDNEDEFQLV